MQTKQLAVSHLAVQNTIHMNAVGLLGTEGKDIIRESVYDKAFKLSHSQRYSGEMVLSATNCKVLPLIPQPHEE